MNQGSVRAAHAVPASLVCLLPALCHGARSEARVVVFPAPDGIEASQDWRLHVEGREVFCYQDYRLNPAFPPSLFAMKVSPQAYAIFDFAGPVRVRAMLMSNAIADLRELKIRPLALGVRPEIAGSSVEFKLDEPGDVTIDPDGTGLRVLHLFTNSPETDVPGKDDPDVVYFGPGVHDIEELVLKPGQTLYLAGGAVVRPLPIRLRLPEKQRHYTGAECYRAVSPVRATGDDVTVRGRGVISGERGLPVGRRFALFQGSRISRLRIEGVVFTRSTGWTLLMHACRDSILERVRVLGYFTNADGFCLHSCQDCRVTDCFVHTADDCYEVKAEGSGIVFENSQAWCDAGTSMGVCHEINGLMTDVTWRNMTVLHYTYPYNPYEGITSRGALFVHPAMGDTVRDVRFEDITIENCSTERPLILVYNVRTPREGIHFYPEEPFSGISGVVFGNVRVTNALKPSILVMDQSGEGLVRDIAFENVVINGSRLIEGDARLHVEGDLAGNVVR
jgi:hypothetical protein